MKLIRLPCWVETYRTTGWLSFQPCRRWHTLPCNHPYFMNRDVETWPPNTETLQIYMISCSSVDPLWGIQVIPSLISFRSTRPSLGIAHESTLETSSPALSEAQNKTPPPLPDSSSTLTPCGAILSLRLWTPWSIYHAQYSPQRSPSRWNHKNTCWWVPCLRDSYT